MPVEYWVPCSLFCWFSNVSLFLARVTSSFTCIFSRDIAHRVLLPVHVGSTADPILQLVLVSDYVLLGRQASRPYSDLLGQYLCFLPNVPKCLSALYCLLYMLVVGREKVLCIVQLGNLREVKGLPWWACPRPFKITKTWNDVWKLADNW